MILKYLHIALVFGAIVLIYGTEVMLHRIGKTGDTRSIRTAFAVAKPIATVAPAIFWIGVAFGLAAGVVNGYNLLAPWLLATYVLVGIIMAGALTLTVPWMQRVGAMSAAAPDGATTPELSAALHDRPVTLFMYAAIVVDFVIVALMVFKPGA